MVQRQLASQSPRLSNRIPKSVGPLASQSWLSRSVYLFIYFFFNELSRRRGWRAVSVLLSAGAYEVAQKGKRELRRINDNSTTADVASDSNGAATATTSCSPGDLHGAVARWAD